MKFDCNPRPNVRQKPKSKLQLHCSHNCPSNRPMVDELQADPIVVPRCSHESKPWSSSVYTHTHTHTHTLEPLANTRARDAHANRRT
eukprot:6522608-Pyramimonas_sp.AAC.1